MDISEKFDIKTENKIFDIIKAIKNVNQSEVKVVWTLIFLM